MTDTADRPSPAAASPDFPIEWLTPHDAELSWEWDDMHMPMSVAPLAADYTADAGVGLRLRLPAPRDPGRDPGPGLNGYAYFTVDDRGPRSRSAMRCGRAVTRRPVRRSRSPMRTGANGPSRSCARHYGWVAAAPVEAMPADELAAAWDEAWARIGRCWSIHFYAIRGPYQVLEDLADLYESVVEDASPGEALGLIGGGVHELHDGRAAARGAGRHWSVADARGRRSLPASASVTVAELAARPEAAALMDGPRRIPGRRTAISARASTTSPCRRGPRSPTCS